VTEIDDCRLHQCKTVLQMVAVVNAMLPGLKSSPAYVMARRELFPNSDDVLTGRGAWRSLSMTQVAVCEQCCQERDTFLLTKYPLWSKEHQLAS
jgi:hypothetical protein